MTDLAVKKNNRTQKKGNLFELNKFFGPREGEGIRQFVEEVKLLGNTDIALLANGIRNETYTY